MAKINVKSVKPVDPKCYAYTLPSIPDLDGWTKIGYTEREVETRVKEQTHTAGVKPKIHWGLPARFDTKPRDSFTDRAFHRYLERLGIERQTGHEWFAIEPAQAKNTSMILGKIMVLFTLMRAIHPYCLILCASSKIKR